MPHNRFAVRSSLRLLALSAVVATSLGWQTPASANPLDEVVGLQLINETRIAHGVCPLVLEPGLTTVANQWSTELSQRGRLAHNLVGLKARVFNGETVGYGQDLGAVHGRFLASPAHFANVTKDTYTSVGIGVVQAGPWTWVTYDFLSADNLAHRC